MICSRTVTARVVLFVAAASMSLNLLSTGYAEDYRFEGFTEPYHQIELAVGESGVLSEVHVKEGMRVQRDQILARLDTTVLERTLEIARQRSQAVGALRAAQAELELRNKYLQQLSQLYDRGHATQREYDRAATDLKVAEARVAIAEEELALQRLECLRIEAQIERRILRSPISGVVSEVQREVGESFLANDPCVMTIVQLDRLSAKFSLEPARAQVLKAGQSVSVTLGDDASALQGVVESISPVMDAKSATVEITVAIENPDESIPSGVRCWLLVSHSPVTANKRTHYTSVDGQLQP